MSKCVAVLGSGQIGRGWALVFARAGRPVRLWTPPAARSDETRGDVDLALADLAEAGLLADQEPAAVAARIRLTSDLPEALDGAGWIQVTTEDDAAPPAIAEHVQSTSIVAWSQRWPPGGATGRAESQLLILAQEAPHLLPLVELVPGAATSAAAMATAEETLHEIGLRPILLRRPAESGVAQALAAALLDAALDLLERGLCGPEDVDMALRHGLGPGWAVAGAFETADLSAPGGVREAARGWRRAPSAALLDEIEVVRRIRLLESDLDARRRWRERRLLALAAHQRRAGSEIGD
jgi:3-hydroxyacyl-CoA dehydrogenase